jgi:hypothetical protein
MLAANLKEQSNPENSLWSGLIYYVCKPKTCTGQFPFLIKSMKLRKMIHVVLTIPN